MLNCVHILIGVCICILVCSYVIFFCNFQSVAQCLRFSSSYWKIHSSNPISAAKPLLCPWANVCLYAWIWFCLTYKSLWIKASAKWIKTATLPSDKHLRISFHFWFWLIFTPDALFIVHAKADSAGRLRPQRAHTSTHFHIKIISA